MLLVEDEKEIRELLENEFRDRGFTVTTAASGDSAARYLNDGAFDILVTDINMPGILSGLDLVWRARAFLIRLPAVIITGRSYLVTQSLSDSEIVVGKPFAMSQLTSAVEKLLH